MTPPPGPSATSVSRLVWHVSKWYFEYMAKSVSFADVLKLNISERLLLVEDLWDSIAAFPKAIKLTPSQRQELDHRLNAFRKDPTAGSPWSEVKKRILRRG